MRRIILKDVKIKQAEPEGGIDLPCIHTRNRGERRGVRADVLRLAGLFTGESELADGAVSTRPQPIDQLRTWP